MHGKVSERLLRSSEGFYSRLRAVRASVKKRWHRFPAESIWVAPLVQCYLFSGGALVFYVFLRGAMSPFSTCFLCSTFFYVVEEPIEQVPLHKWCPLSLLGSYDDHGDTFQIDGSPSHTRGSLNLAAPSMGKPPSARYFLTVLYSYLMDSILRPPPG